MFGLIDDLRHALRVYRGAGATAGCGAVPLTLQNDTWRFTQLRLRDVPANVQVIALPSTGREPRYAFDAASRIVPSDISALWRIDGRTLKAVYDVTGVTDLSIAPDSRTFVYSVGSGQLHSALVRVPQWDGD